MFVTYTH